MNIKMADITTLGRPFGPRYPTHRAIALLSVAVILAGAIARLIRGTPFRDSIAWGVGAGLSLFLAWALARELDPDHDLSAFVGAGLMLIALLLFDPPSLLVILWLLLALRIVNRTVGLPARPLDSLAVLGLGGWLTWQGHWIAGLMTAVAFLLDGLLSPALRIHLLASGLAFATTGVLSVLQGDLALGSGPAMPIVISSGVMAGLLLVVVATSRDVQSVGDATGDPLNPRRVQAAQILALLTALLYAWRAGAAGVMALRPLWAAMIGVALYRLAILFLSRNQVQTEENNHA
jgi:hypothetical protein